MRKFELCFDLEPDQQFLIPDLLSKEEPDTGQWSDTLAFQYHYNVLPGSIISRFIVRASQLISERTYWRSGAVLAWEDSRGLVKADREDKKILIWVSGFQTTQRQLLGIIRSHFAHIHSTITGIEVASKVPLPGHSDVMLDYQDLLEYEAAGEIEPFIPALKGRINVKQLLDGIEPQELRQESREGNLIKYDLRGATIYGFSPETIGSPLVAGQTVKGNQVTGTQHQSITQSVTDSPGSNISALQGDQNQVTQEQLTKEDILNFLSQIKDLIAAADLSSEVKAEANANLKVAQKATNREEKQTIAIALEEVAETLQTTSKTVEAGKTLWSQIAPLLVKVGRWAGAAVGTFLGG